MSHTVTSLMNEPLDGYKGIIAQLTDLTLLRQLVTHCEKTGFGTRMKAASRRLRQLKKGAACVE